MSFYPIFIFSTPFICFWGRKQNCGVEKNLHIIIFILSQIYYDLSQDKNNLSLCVSLLETFINILLLKSKRPNVVRIVERRVGFCYLYYISLHKKSKCFFPFLHLPSILLTSSYIHSPQILCKWNTPKNIKNHGSNLYIFFISSVILIIGISLSHSAPQPFSQATS